jgi:hypothetical protein
MWCRWDSFYYLDIAARGYEFSAEVPSNSVFFPLYPLTMRAVHAILWLPGDDAGWATAGLIVSNLALLIALFYLFLLVRIDFDETTAARSVLYMSIFPTTLFLSAVYTESSFLALVVSGFYYARKNRWIVAGTLAAAATLCRAQGVLLLLPFLFEYLAQRRFRIREIRADFLAFAFIPLATAAHATYFYYRFHEWMALFKAHIAWQQRALASPTLTIWRFFYDPHPLSFHDNTSLDFVFLFFLALVAVLVLMRLRASYGIYVVLSLLFAIIWGMPMSVARFGLAMFPIVIALALLGRNPSFNRFYVIISTGLAAFFMIVFSQWGWVA